MQPYGINESGNVAGTALGNGGALYPFRYTKSTNTAEQIVIVPGCPTCVSAYGLAINNSDVVVGKNFTQAPGQSAVTPPVNGYYNAILDSGAFVGIGYNVPDGGPGEAFEYDSATGIRWLGRLPGYWFNGVTQAFGIDPSGRVVGTAYPSDSYTPHAFLYSGAGPMRDLNDLAVASPFVTLDEANAVNASFIIGDGLLSMNGPLHGFRFHNDTDTVDDIGALPTQGAQAYSYAIGLNSRGDVVGYSRSLATGENRAILCTNEGQLIDLNTYVDPNDHWLLEIANGINRNFEIVGYGTHEGVRNQGFKITVPDPTPSPACAPPTDPCQMPGVWDPSSNQCSYAARADGTTCDDKNACSRGDTCHGGHCQGASQVDCTPDQCHTSGTCDPATGVCSYQPAADNQGCDDGNSCTDGDYCQQGTCLPGNANRCQADLDPTRPKFVSAIDLGGGGLVDLGATKGWSSATGINNNGEVVGSDQLSDTLTQGFTWTPTQGLKHVPWRNGRSLAVDVNDSGVLSMTTGQDFGGRPCRFDVMSDTQPMCESVAGSGGGINQNGVMTGSDYYRLPGPSGGMMTLLRMIRKRGAEPADILVPSYTVGNYYMAGTDIDDDGTVVGRQMEDPSTGWFPIRYSDSRLQKTELIADLLSSTTVGAEWNVREVFGIHKGQMVGWGWHSGYGARAFLMKTAENGDVTGITDLGLPPEYREDTASIPIAKKMNSAGEIVGAMYDSIPYWPLAAFVYTEAQGMVDLNTLLDPQSGWQLLAAYDINESHEVVGEGTHNGVRRAFKLTLPNMSPCPAPADECHVQGTRDLLTGVCSNPVRPGGPAGATDVTCTPRNCQLDMCNPRTGECTSVAAANGESCDDGDLCTQNDTCLTGTCGGGSVEVCSLRGDVRPTLLGIATDSKGQTKAVFDYTTSVQSVTIPYGEQNYLSDESGGIATPQVPPPQTFVAAPHPPFILTLAGSELSWTVGRYTAKATRSSPRLQTTTAEGGTRDATLPGGRGKVNIDATPPAEATIQPDPGVGDSFNGVLAGQLSVSPTGAATYTLPIKLPPGIAGMAPTMSLTYSSQAGDGLAGQGWDLTGLSMIHRCPKTVVQDGYNQPVQMNALDGRPGYGDTDEAHHDGICLDGRRLFPKPGSLGSYLAENEDFSGVTKNYDNPYANDSGATTYFTVVTKSGETRFYGSTTKSRVRFPALDPNDPSRDIAVWVLDMVVDAWGNYYKLHYNDDNEDFSARGLLLTSIEYTGHLPGTKQNPVNGSSTSVPDVAPFNTVAFQYETRPDVRQVRFRNDILRRNQRLKSISTGAGTYTLTYLANDPANPQYDPMLPSRLDSIRYCAATSSKFPEGQCLKDLQFGWQGGGYDWQPAPSGFSAVPAPIGTDSVVLLAPNQSLGTQFLDLDGDGRADLISGAAFETYGGAWRNTGSGWERKSMWDLPSTTSGSVILSDENKSPTQAAFVDMDGDGMLDLVASMYGCSPGNAVENRHCSPFITQVWLNTMRTGGGWQLHTEFNAPGVGIGQIFAPLDVGGKATFADLNHDGRADLIRLGPGQYQVDVYYNTPSGWSGPVAIGGYDNGLIVGYVTDYHFEDINRDGLPDLVGNAGSGGAGTVAIYLGPHPSGKLWAMGAGVPQEFVTRNSSNSAGPAMADIDGDGRYDRAIGTYSSGQPGIQDGWYMGVAMATGFGFDYGEWSWLANTPNATTRQTSPVPMPYALALQNSYYPIWQDIGLRDSEFAMPDLNGDGLADFAVPTVADNANLINFRINDGSTWVAPGNARLSQNLPATPGYSRSSAFVDLNGDGILDVVRSDKYGTSKAWLNTFQKPLIWHFPNGLAQTTDVTYDTITTQSSRDTGVYSDDNSLDPGSQYLAIPMQVVSSVARDSSLNTGSKPKTTYQYSALRGSAMGRGPQGFRQVATIEPDVRGTVGTTTVTTYSQVYPYTGLASTVARYKGTKLLAATSTTYCDALDQTACTDQSGYLPSARSLPQTPVFVYPMAVTDAAFEFAGDQLAGYMLTATSFKYDSYGNPTEVTVETTNSATQEKIKKTITNVYGSNIQTATEEGKRLGKVIETDVTTQRLAPLDGNTIARVHTTKFDYSRPTQFGMPPNGTPQGPLALFKTRSEPDTPALQVTDDMPDYLELHTVYDYDGFGNVITTTACGSDFNDCAPGVVNSSASDDPAHPPFRTTRTSYDPGDFNAPVGPGLTSTLAYGVGDYNGVGRFPVRTTNPAGHQEYVAYDPVKGVLLQKTGPNGIHTCFTYDDLGQELTEVDRCGVDNLTTSLGRFYATTADPPNASIVSVTRVPSGSSSWVYTDVLGRKVATLTRSFQGGFVETKTDYDALDRVAADTKPYFPGDTQFSSSTLYDGLGRLSSVSSNLGPVDSDGATASKTVSTTYLPAAVRTDQLVAGVNQYRIETKNALGKLSSVKELVDPGSAPHEVTISYWYDADGNLTNVGDPASYMLPTAHMDYDQRGRKTRSIDPDLGTWRYAYNAFGDLTIQTDAKGQRTTMTYDVLGRMTTKTDAEGTATWVYDVASGAGIGKLAAMVGPPDPARSGSCPVPYGAPRDGSRAAHWYTYTSNGDVDQSSECVSGEVFETNYGYDWLGRQATITYPAIAGNRLTTGYHYTSLGYLFYVTDESDYSVLWAATDMNALGQVTVEHTRNGVETTKTLSPATGWLLTSSSIAAADGSSKIGGWTYAYDEAGNVLRRSRTDSLINGPSVETFGYDTLNRIRTADIAVASENYGNRESYTYDDIGNLTSKNGQVYTYSGCSARSRLAGPHAVCFVGSGTPFEYDDNGNVTSDGRRRFDYNSVNRTLRIVGAQAEVDYAYGADGARITQTVVPTSESGGSGSQTVYVGLGATGRSLYERTTHGSGPIEHTQFIYAGGAHAGNAFAVRVTTQGGSVSAPSTTYQQFDGLGSITTVSDEQGHVVSPSVDASGSGELGYDVWGARRSPNGQTSSGTTFALQPGHREYTGHEAIPELGLINMNGRVYDPELGRFLSADPNVQFASSLQSYNRYTYVLNNPLRNVDPTGYFLDDIGSQLSQLSGPVLSAAQVAVCVAYPQVCAGIAVIQTALATTSMLTNGTPIGQIVAVDSISLFAGAIGGAVGGGIGAGIAGEGASLGAQVVGGAIGGALSTALVDVGSGRELGWNVFEGAAIGALNAAVGWATRADPVAQGGGGSGEARNEAAEARAAGDAAWRSQSRTSYMMAEGDFLPSAGSDPLVQDMTFDGSRLRLFEPENYSDPYMTPYRREIADWPAVSGRDGYQSPTNQGLAGKGPLPAGDYLARQSSLQSRADTSFGDKALGLIGRGQWPGGGRSWGDSRLWLDAMPGTDTLGRSGFSIHGGASFGSAGCIDLAGGMNSFVSQYRLLNQDLVVRVQY